MDAPDTAIPDRGVYATKTNACGCTGVPEGQHIPGCEHNDTRSPNPCENCGYRGKWAHGVCSHCGFLSRCPERHPNISGVYRTTCVDGLVRRWTTDEETGEATDSYYKEWCPEHRSVEATCRCSEGAFVICPIHGEADPG